MLRWCCCCCDGFCMVPRILIFAKIIHWNMKLLPHTKRKTTPECVCWDYAIICIFQWIWLWHTKRHDSYSSYRFSHTLSECEETHRHFPFVPARSNNIFTIRWLWQEAGETLREPCEPTLVAKFKGMHKHHKMRMVDLREMTWARISVWPITWAHYPDSCRFFHFSCNLHWFHGRATLFIDSPFLEKLPLPIINPHIRCSSHWSEFSSISRERERAHRRVR